MFVAQMASRRSFFILLLIALRIGMIAAAPAQAFPDVIPLPDGFQPEGIAVGKGSTFYVGSIPTGAGYRGDLRTGEGAVLVPAQAGRAAIGLKYDERTGLLFVAGGATGFAYLYNGETGANVAEIQLTTADSFINDVVVTRTAAYFTNSRQAILYRVPLENNGQLPSPPTVEEIPQPSACPQRSPASAIRSIRSMPASERRQPQTRNMRSCVYLENNEIDFFGNNLSAANSRMSANWVEYFTKFARIRG